MSGDRKQAYQRGLRLNRKVDKLLNSFTRHLSSHTLSCRDQYTDTQKVTANLKCQITETVGLISEWERRNVYGRGNLTVSIVLICQVNSASVLVQHRFRLYSSPRGRSCIPATLHFTRQYRRNSKDPCTRYSFSASKCLKQCDRAVYLASERYLTLVNSGN